MNAKEFRELRANVAKLRAGAKVASTGELPTSVSYLENLLAETNSPADRACIYALLSDEYVRFGETQRRIKLLRLRVNDFPDDPTAYCALGAALAREPGGLAEGLAILNQAVSVARTTNRLLRYSLTEQARVAVDVGEMGLLNDTLKELINDRWNDRKEDIGFEGDLLDNLDAAHTSRLDAELVREFTKLTKK